MTCYIAGRQALRYPMKVLCRGTHLRRTAYPCKNKGFSILNLSWWLDSWVAQGLSPAAPFTSGCDKSHPYISIFCPFLQLPEIFSSS